MPGDRIKAVDGEDVNTNWQFEEMLDGRFEPKITLLAQRKEKSGEEQLIEGHLKLGYPAPVISADENETGLSNVCGMIPRMRITAVSRTFSDWFRGLLHLKQNGEKLKAGDIISGCRRNRKSDIFRAASADKGIQK